MGNFDYVHGEPYSIESKFIQLLSGILGMKKRFTRMVTKNKFPKKPARIPSDMAKTYNIEEIEHFGRKTWIISPKSVDPDRMILYFHGGAYFSNISGLHWAFIRQLLLHTQSQVIIPDYPLAPESTCEEVYQFAKTLYLELLTKYPSKQITIMGDSAGGGLALGLCQHLMVSHHKIPDQIILLSPWLDVTMSNPDIPLTDKYDKILSTEGLKIAGQQYAGNIHPKDFRVSPIYGELSGLCPISVFIGTHDVLLADARKLKQLLEAAGVENHYFEYPGMFHDWMLVTQMKESGQVIQQISRIMTS
jgi:acetyl esterase/lipase